MAKISFVHSHPHKASVKPSTPTSREKVLAQLEVTTVAIRMASSFDDKVRLLSIAADLTAELMRPEQK